MWAYDLDTEAWARLREDRRPALGGVLAATYSAPQDVLWVLDVVNEPPGRGRSRGGPDRVRLLRLHPVTGSGEVVASWARRASPGNDRFAMSVDPSGAIYVAGWREHGFAHAVLRLRWEPDSGVALLGWRFGAGRVLAPTVRASDRGLSFYAEVGLRRIESRAYDAGELLTAGDGFDRCF